MFKQLIYVKNYPIFHTFRNIYVLVIRLHMPFTEASFLVIFLLVLKSFSYTVCLNHCPVEQRHIEITFFLAFLSVMVKIQLENLFKMLNY